MTQRQKITSQQWALKGRKWHSERNYVNIRKQLTAENDVIGKTDTAEKKITEPETNRNYNIRSVVVIFNWDTIKQKTVRRLGKKWGHQYYGCVLRVVSVAMCIYVGMCMFI